MPPTMHAGRMRDRVRIEQPADAKTPNGQRNKGWDPVATRPACVEATGGREVWVARTVQVDATDVVTVRYDEALALAAAKWRVVVLTQSARVLNVESVRRVERVWLELMCRGENRTA